MTEQTEQTEATGAETSGRRGRPRPLDTLERDERVLELLRTAGPLTTAEIAEKLQLEGKSIAYLSVYRLSRSGKVAKSTGENAKNKWEVAPASD